MQVLKVYQSNVLLNYFNFQTNILTKNGVSNVVSYPYPYPSRFHLGRATRSHRHHRDFGRPTFACCAIRKRSSQENVLLQ